MNGGDWGISSIIGTVIGWLHAFLPMQLINERAFEVEKAEANSLDYEHAQPYFITDYSRENPIYKQRARKSYVAKMTVRLRNINEQERSDFVRVDSDLQGGEEGGGGGGDDGGNVGGDVGGDGVIKVRKIDQ